MFSSNCIMFFKIEGIVLSHLPEYCYLVLGKFLLRDYYPSSIIVVWRQSLLLSIQCCVKQSWALRVPAEEAIQIQFATNQISRKWMLFFHLLPLWNWHDMPFRETKWSRDINKSHFKNEQIHISEHYWWWKAGSWGTKKEIIQLSKGFRYDRGKEKRIISSCFFHN